MLSEVVEEILVEVDEMSLNNDWMLREEVEEILRRQSRGVEREGKEVERMLREEVEGLLREKVEELLQKRWGRIIDAGIGGIKNRGRGDVNDGVEGLTIKVEGLLMEKVE